jgi:hypothetical protein
MRRVLVACVAVAAASLVLPSQPSYDPWAWIVWGREIWQFELDTSGGPSWKPGTVIFTTLFAPFGETVAPALWLVVARAGGLLALVLAFRLGRRLGGGVAAGVVAAVALAALPLWLRYLAHGNEAPLAVALMLWALERELDGRRDHATLLLFGACLLRPEVFPFLAVLGVLLWRSQPERRPLLAGLALALPLLWLVPEWIGSGDLLGGGEQALSRPPWSISSEETPWLAALERAHSLAGLELEAAALAGLAFAAFRRERAILVLAGVGTAWLVLVVVMTQYGFSGANRYFLPPLVVGCLLAGVGVGRALRTPLAPAAVALVVAFGLGHSGDLSDEANMIESTVRDGERTETRLKQDGILPAGLRRRHWTLAAWELRRPLGDIERVLDQKLAGPAKAL